MKLPSSDVLADTPAPDGRTWDYCGHPRTPENTAPFEVHGRCRVCHRARTLKSAHKRRKRELAMQFGLEPQYAHIPRPDHTGHH